MDRQALDFYQRTRAGYFKLAENEPERWVRIDAAGPVEEVAEAVMAVVMRELERRGRRADKQGA